MNKGRRPQAEGVLPLLLGVLVGVGYVWVEPVWGQQKAGKEKEKDEVAEKVEMAGAAKVTIDQAIKAALQEVQGTVIEAELEEKPRVTWEVEIVTADGKVMEVLVDIDTGAIVSTEEEEAEDDKEDTEKLEQDKGAETAQTGGMMHRQGGMGMPGCCGMGMHQGGGAKSK